jgi:hypothetical protein
MRTNKWSYGGNILKSIRHSKHYPILPNDHEFVPCHLGTANFLVVDAHAVKKIGFSQALMTTNMRVLTTP